MITLTNDSLSFRAPAVHADAGCRIEFQRTLRIPDDNRDYPLPPGLGPFPLRAVAAHAAALPAAWATHGGVLLPMYQAEALWISFHSPGYPFAVKIAAGKINAVTGAAWRDELSDAPQDYVVLPTQPWLDGFCVRKGLIRQFVAMPLGQGYTAEEQLTRAAVHGGLQIVAYPMQRERYAGWCAARRRAMQRADLDGLRFSRRAVDVEEMGLAPGGLMRQQIHADPFGLDAWDVDHGQRCFVHLLNSAQWRAVTGSAPPSKPPKARDYAAAGLPWFEWYDERAVALAGSRRLAALDGVAAKALKLGQPPLPDNDAVVPAPVVILGPHAGQIADGEW